MTFLFCRYLSEVAENAELIAKLTPAHLSKPLGGAVNANIVVPGNTPATTESTSVSAAAAVVVVADQGASGEGPGVAAAAATVTGGGPNKSKRSSGHASPRITTS